MPEIVAVPLPLLVKFTPLAIVPLRVMFVAYDVGLPAVVIVKFNRVPDDAVTAAALEKVGTATLVPAVFTVRAIVWLVDPPPLVAVIATE